MQTLWQDLRYAIRMLIKRPGFTAVAVIALALGIGANTAIFSVVNGVLLRSVPYKNPERIVAVESMNPQGGKGIFGAVSPADFWDWKERSRTFENLAVYSGDGYNLPSEDRAESIAVSRVSVNFFDVFGVEPLMGRFFTEEEGLQSGPRSMILSHRLWLRRFSGDPAIVGKAIETDRGSVTVIAIMPPGFKYPSHAEAWTALARDSGEMTFRANRYFAAIGRINEDQTIESAQSEMKAIAASLEEAHPKDNQNWTVQLTLLSQHQVRDSRYALLMLMGAVGFLLLIACANVANLMLARAVSRQKEMAIRLAMGATRRHLIKQLLTESLLLALAGGALGLLIAASGVKALMNLLPKTGSFFQSMSGAQDDVHIDAAVLVFTLLVSALTGIVFGLLPGLQASKPAVSQWLKEGVRSSEGARHQRIRSTLVVVEIALAMVLLAGAGLLINSFVRLQRADMGYDPRGLMTMTLSLPAQNKTQFVRQTLERINQTPGIESASVMSFLTPGGLNFPFNLESRPLPSGDQNASYSAISPDYFRTMKARIVSGREFNDRDIPAAPRVAIINETMARDYFSEENPIGKKIVISYLGQRISREIVGVASDMKQDEPDAPAKPEIFVPFEQQPWFAAWLLIRTHSSDPLTMGNAVQTAIREVNSNHPPSRAESMEQRLSDLVAQPRLYTLLLAVFASVAMIMAAVGIYGVMSYSVTERTHEIGIRLALGAAPGDVMRAILGRGMLLTLIGLATGAAAALLLTRLMSGLLYQVSPTDPATFIGISVVLAAVALGACFVPALRAVRVDPMIALRRE